MVGVNGCRLIYRVAGPGSVFIVVACWTLASLVWSHDTLAVGLSLFLIAALILGSLFGEAASRLRAARFAWTLPDVQRVVLRQVLELGCGLLTASALLAGLTVGASAALGLLGAQALVFSLGLVLGAWGDQDSALRGLRITMRGMRFTLVGWFLGIAIQISDVVWRSLLTWQAGIVSSLVAGLVFWLWLRSLSRRRLRQGADEAGKEAPGATSSLGTGALVQRSCPSDDWRTWLQVALFESLEVGGSKRWWMPFLLGPPALLATFLGCHLFADWYHPHSVLFGGDPSTLIAGAMSWLTLMILLPGFNVPRPRLRHPVSRAMLARSTFAGSLLLTATCLIGILTTFLLYCASLSLLVDELSPDALLPGLRILAVALLAVPVLQWRSLTKRGEQGVAWQALAVLALIAAGWIAYLIGGSWQLLIWLTTMVLVLYSIYGWSVRSYFRRASLL